MLYEENRTDKSSWCARKKIKTPNAINKQTNAKETTQATTLEKKITLKFCLKCGKEIKAGHK